MESRQGSFFSSKMENFLCDTENKARQRAMAVAVKEANMRSPLQTDALGKSEPLRAVQPDAQVKQIPKGAIAFHRDNLMMSRAKGPLVHTQYALASAALPVGLPGVEIRRDPMVPLTIATRHLATVEEVSSEILRGISPKKLNEPEIKIEANEHLVRRACCFWDCRVND